MHIKTFSHTPLYVACITCSMGLFASSANAALVNVDISASWTTADYSVTGAGDPTYNPADPEVDGKVFGVSPSTGSTTIHLLVDTSSFVSYSAGYTYNHLGTDYTLAHDWYGYQDVQLASPYSFGSASFNETSIVDLSGVDGLTMKLWTDSDITNSDPTLASFRIGGTGDGLSADLFVGSHSPSTIGTQFLLWEYFGEEIRVDGYSVSAVPVPAAAWLFGSGLLGLIGIARRKT